MTETVKVRARCRVPFDTPRRGRSRAIASLRTRGGCTADTVRSETCACEQCLPHRRFRDVPSHGTNKEASVGRAKRRDDRNFFSPPLSSFFFPPRSQRRQTFAPRKGTRSEIEQLATQSFEAPLCGQPVAHIHTGGSAGTMCAARGMNRERSSLAGATRRRRAHG